MSQQAVMLGRDSRVGLADTYLLLDGTAALSDADLVIAARRPNARCESGGSG